MNYGYRLREQYLFNKTKLLNITFIPKRLSFDDQLDICIVYNLLYCRPWMNLCWKIAPSIIFSLAWFFDCCDQAESLVEKGRIISVQTRTELNQQADNLEQEIRQLELRSGGSSSGQVAWAQVRWLELRSGGSSSGQVAQKQVVRQKELRSGSWSSSLRAAWAQVRQLELRSDSCTSGQSARPQFRARLKGLVAWCHSFCLFWYYVLYNIHSYSKFIRHHSPRFLSISSSLVSSVGKTSLGCRAENRSRARLTASQRTTIWAMPHPSELRRTLWATPHL